MRIAYLEDEVETAACVASWLRDAGYQVEIFHSGEACARAVIGAGFDAVLNFNKSPAFLKHWTNLVELQKDKTYDYSGRTNNGEGRFTSGECPIFLTSSGFFGNVRANAKFDWGNAAMPYYPDVQGAPFLQHGDGIGGRPSGGQHGIHQDDFPFADVLWQFAEIFNGLECGFVPVKADMTDLRRRDELPDPFHHAQASP